MEKHLNTHNDIHIEEFNKIVERAAEKTLMSKYKRRLLKNNQRKSEAPWVNDEFRSEIKKKKKLNREKRNCNDVTKRELYIKQKKLVQTKIREQMNIYEMKITNDIRQDRSRGKKIWDNINKLRGKITDKDKKSCSVYR